jgi:hypothetical protein
MPELIEEETFYLNPIRITPSDNQSFFLFLIPLKLPTSTFSSTGQRPIFYMHGGIRNSFAVDALFYFFFTFLIMKTCGGLPVISNVVTFAD